MQPVLIPCPECGKELKLRDRSLIGRKGKCPQCANTFVLNEPEEVELELADGDTPAVGTSARWVPDEPTAAPVATASPPVAAAPQIQINDTDAKPTGGYARKAAARKRKKNLTLWVTLGSTVSGMILAVVIAKSLGGKPAGNGKDDANNGGAKSSQNASTNNNRSAPVVPVGDFPQPDVPADPPPKGKPIALNFVPTGARMIIHLRPADLWKVNSQAETVRLCLGGRLNNWLEAFIKKHLLWDPGKIEQVTICLFLDDKTQAPDAAYVVKFVEPLKKKSEFIEKFGGKRNDDQGRAIYVTDATSDRPNRAYLITDRYGGGFVSVPAAMTADMVHSIKHPGLPNGGLEELLKLTDTNRHVTLLFNPRDLDNFKEHLFPADLRGLARQFYLRFDSDSIESIAWSFHFGSPAYRDFYSEILLRNQTVITPRLLQVDMKRKFEALPDDVANILRTMRPRYMSERKLVSRLPVMMQAFQIETVPQVPDAERYIRLTTALPDIAGPNLAAAGMLAWRLSHADHSKPPPKSGGTKKPVLVADKLKKEIEVDFRRLPLQEAFDYIGGETLVKFTIDGDALKDAGYTKNMPQTFKMDETPAIKAVGKILSQYQAAGKEMVIVVDEKSKKVIVTTKKFAKKNGQKPYPLP